MDLLKKIPSRIWIGSGETGFWQAVEYERIPKYCTGCSKQGHDVSECRFDQTRKEMRTDVREKLGVVNEGLVEERRVYDVPLIKAITIDEGSSQVLEGNKHQWREVNRREGKQLQAAETEDHLQLMNANSSRRNKGIIIIREGGLDPIREETEGVLIQAGKTTGVIQDG